MASIAHRSVDVASSTRNSSTNSISGSGSSRCEVDCVHTKHASIKAHSLVVNQSQVCLSFASCAHLCVQYPDPHVRQKRHVVHAEFVRDVTALLMPGGGSGEGCSCKFNLQRCMPCTSMWIPASRSMSLP